MNTSPATPEQRPSPRRSWPRRIVMLLLVMVGLVLAFYAFENWRGHRAWKNYAQQAKAKGVPLDWKSDWPKRQLTAKPLSEAGLPFDPTFDKATSLLTSSVLDRDFEDLVAWEQAISALKSGKQPDTLRAEGFKIAYGNTNAADRVRAAQAVLEIFKADEPFFNQVRAACHRPELLYPFWEDTPDQVSPAGVVLRVFTSINMARMLRVKSAAELALGDNAAALRNLDLLLCLSESLRNDPLLISHIGHLATFQIALRFPWEGLALQKFSDPELKQLQEMLGSDDLITLAHRAILGDRAAWLPFFDLAKNSWSFQKMLGGKQGQPVDLVVLSIPAGWYDLDKLHYARSFDAIISSAFPESGNRRVNPSQLQVASASVIKKITDGKLKHIFQHTLLSAIITPRVDETIRSSCRAQVIRDQTRLACGLERYFLKHASYPEKLEQIIPEYLSAMPNDPLTGAPYHFARTANGRYRIWSVGWDEKDDGGTPNPKGQEDKDGDWVWQYL